MDLVKRFGPAGSASVVVVHGGPGAQGGADALAEALSDPLTVIAPHQRRSGGIHLSVAQHVEDLRGLLATGSTSIRPALVGESWGAMLALAFAAAHPDRVSALCLVGCGTFDEASRQRMQETIEERTTPELRAEMVRLAREVPHVGGRMARIHDASDGIYTFSRAAPAPTLDVDADGHTETWDDMLRLQEDGTYPESFAAITCPVLMLHGSYDPHPGPMIRDNLKQFIPQLGYVEFDRCGHSPWVEEFARDEFIGRLRDWLAGVA